jgi:RNA recognition motif-containing protein
MISIFVAKLDFGIDNDQLKAMFDEYGRVLKATVALDRETRKSRGFGFVEMANEEEGQAAIAALDGKLVNGRPIAVKEAEDRGGAKTDRRPPGDRPRRDDGPGRSAAPREGGDARPFTPRPPSTPSVPDTDTDSFADKGERKKDRVLTKKEKPKTHKMEAYRKSGKNNIIIDEDDDEPLNLFDYGDEDDEAEFDSSYLINNDDDEEDEEDNWDEEE